MMSLDNTSRRTVLKSAPVALGVVGGLSKSVTADDDETEALGDDAESENVDPESDDLDLLLAQFDNEENYDGEEIARIEYNLTGNFRTTVQNNRFGLAWAMNCKDVWPSYYFTDTTLEFDLHDWKNPADSSINWVDGYWQGDGTVDEEHVQYAVDMLWSTANLPIPNPIDVSRDEELDVDRPGSSFEHDIGDFFGRINGDATGGAHFQISFGDGTGELVPGEYYYTANLSTEMYRNNRYGSDPHIASLDTEFESYVIVEED